MKSKKFLSYLLSLVLLSATIVFMPSTKAFAAETQRLQGSDRYGTAIAISKAGWQTSDNVILATGNDFPDALSAAPLAKQLNAPILLVDKTLDSTLEAELNRLQVKNVFIVGGIGVVSDDIQSRLEKKGLIVTRLSGEDRYKTSLKIADYLAASFKMSTEIVIATGEDFPDALSIASVAASKNMPIILSQKAELPGGVKTYVTDNKVSKAFIIGGTGVIDDKVMQQLPSPERVWGADRFATNVAVLNRFASDFSFDKVYAATGNDFPDALTGSALAQKTASPIILTDKTMSPPTAAYLDWKMPYIKQIGVLGGEGVVPQYLLSNNVYGNTHGNISNFGIVATQGDWVYYNNNTLYKVKTDGTGKKEISTDVPVFINVVGDWVYYIEATSQTNQMYKVKTDGTGRTKISNDISLYMVVVGDWIYYMNASDQGNLYKMTTDGKNRTKLTNEPALQINVSGDWIYYVTYSGEDIADLYKIKTDGTSRTRLFSSSGIDSLNVSGQYLYFEVTDASGQSGYLEKVKIDGTQSSAISYDTAEFINVSGDWIYFSNISNGDKLYKMKTDGTGKTKISDDDVMFINVSGDWLYYGTYSGEDTIKIKTDGTGRQIVD